MFLVQWIKLYAMIKFLTWILFNPYCFELNALGGERKIRGSGEGVIGSLRREAFAPTIP